MKRLLPTPAIGDEEGLAEARAARRRLLAASLAGRARRGVRPRRARPPGRSIRASSRPTATTTS
jgi:hypothetical protein